jgi:hypothetical protein
MIFSEDYIKEIKKLISKNYTLVITPKLYTYYKDVDKFIYIFGNKVNEKYKIVQIKTSTNKINHYNTNLDKLNSVITHLESVMGQRF